MLKLNDISKSTTTLDGWMGGGISRFSLDLRGGELAVVRRASADEATLLMLVAAGFMPPDAGTVDFMTQTDIYSLSSEEMRYCRAREVGIVSRKFNLIRNMSVRDNITLPEIIEPFPGAGERAELLLRKFGIVSHRDKSPADLSMLDKQKTVLARAMLRLPRILLADEPTENLTDAEAAEILAALREYADEGNSVVIFTNKEEIQVSADIAADLTT